MSLDLLGPPPSMARLCSVMITLGHEVGLECEEVMSVSSRETRMKTKVQEKPGPLSEAE